MRRSRLCHSFVGDLHARETVREHWIKKAVQHNIRPPVGKIASPIVKELLKFSWHPDANSRPSFEFIVKQLELESTTNLASIKLQHALFSNAEPSVP